MRKQYPKLTLVLAILLVSTVAFGQNFNEIIKAVASDRGTNDGFGYSVSVSGDYAILGAPFEDEDVSGNNTLSGAGAAYLFERNGSGNWVEVQKIVASDRDASDSFGYSVSISGSYAIIGSPYEDEDASGNNTLSSAGSAYLFERNGSGVWVEVQKIVASDRGAIDILGTAVSISGNYAIVSARSEKEDASGNNTLSYAGSVYVFERNGSGSWIEAQKIVASDRGAWDTFGYSVSLSGTYAIVGTNSEYEDASGNNTLNGAGS
ncbi:MAG: FG-GAP repeat protein, partial [Flavobacteriales bacterium]|nr:FG-GAP repeat protein [Flavobacteriales bacterium]